SRNSSFVTLWVKASVASMLLSLTPARRMSSAGRPNGKSKIQSPGFSRIIRRMSLLERVPDQTVTPDARSVKSQRAYRIFEFAVVDSPLPLQSTAWTAPSTGRDETVED